MFHCADGNAYSQRHGFGQTCSFGQYFQTELLFNSEPDEPSRGSIHC